MDPYQRGVLLLWIAANDVMIHLHTLFFSGLELSGMSSILALRMDHAWYIAVSIYIYIYI